MDPGDLDAVGDIFPVYAEALDEACAAAREALATWAAPEATEARAAALRRIKAQLQNAAEELGEQLTRETGRPRWDTRQEVRLLRREIDLMLRGGLAELVSREPIPPDCAVEYRPRGVVAILASSSQPAATIHADVIAALAVGCTVVVKPSPLTPGLGQLYATLMHDADLPRGVFNMVQGDDEVGVRLATHEAVDVILFSGRRRSAEQIVEDLSCHSNEGVRSRPLLRARTSGCSLALVLDDANLDEAASEIVMGACLATGQRATTTRGVIVERRIANALRDRLQRMLVKLSVGHGSRPDIFMGPLVSAEASERFAEDATRLRDEAARQHIRSEVNLRATPGDDKSPRGHYVHPGLFAFPHEAFIEALVDELTGPLLLLTEVDNFDEGASLLRESPRRLAHAVFTRDLARVRDLQAKVDAPLLIANASTTTWRGELPLEPDYELGAALASGVLTARTLTTACVTVSRSSAFDATMLPPGLKL